MAEETSVLFEYLPNYAVPPGVTLAEVLDERGMSQVELAQRTDLSPKHINRIVNGHVQISTDVAIRLERATEVPARLWLNLEATYREHLARLDESALLPDLPLLDELPIPAMVKLGILTKRLGKYDRLREALMYLGSRTGTHGSRRCLLWKPPSGCPKPIVAIPRLLRSGCVWTRSQRPRSRYVHLPRKSVSTLESSSEDSSMKDYGTTLRATPSAANCSSPRTRNDLFAPPPGSGRHSIPGHLRCLFCLDHCLP